MGGLLCREAAGAEEGEGEAQAHHRPRHTHVGVAEPPEGPLIFLSDADEYRRPGHAEGLRRAQAAERRQGGASEGGSTLAHRHALCRAGRMLGGWAYARCGTDDRRRAISV